jgi:hypothetical protein
MVGIGGRPILWHIMKVYASFGEIDIFESYLLNDRSDASDLSVHIRMGTIWLEALSSKSGLYQLLELLRRSGDHVGWALGWGLGSDGIRLSFGLVKEIVAEAPLPSGPG